MASSTNSVQPYVYTPLEEGEVRLVDLLPPSAEDDESPISCRVYNVSMDNMPAYEALSYSWGIDPTGRTPSPTILIDGKSLEIMPNLYTFLIQHRKDQISEERRPIWIDAICINQKDLVERRQQVAMMCLLYTRLSRLVVWLGVCEDQDTRNAIAWIKLAAEMEQKGQDALETFQEALFSRYIETGENYTETFGKFFTRSWFCRAWILQEYALGSQKRATFKCGSLQMFQHELMAIRELMARHELMARSISRPEMTRTFSGSAVYLLGMRQLRSLLLSSMFMAAIAREDHGIARRHNLLYWLALMRRSLATDPRDKVYAALGLAESYGQNKSNQSYDTSSLIVDYDVPIQNVYSSVVKAVITSTKKLNVLLSCCQKSRHVTRSWIPDWTCSNAGGFLSLFGDSDGFSCSGANDAAVVFMDDLSTLTVRGLVWDTVKNTCNFDFQVSDPSFEELHNSFMSRNAYSSDREHIQSLWQNCLIESNAARSDLRAEEAFVDLGLDDITDPITKTFRPCEPNLLQKFFTAQVLDEIFPNHGHLIFTDKGFIGRDFSSQVQTGDLVCVLLGCPVPVALRRIGTHYEFIRSLYVDGIMSGEAMEALERGDVQLEDFELH